MSNGHATPWGLAGAPAFVEVAGVTLHARRDGPLPASGAPTLVYLHSLGTDIRIWDGVVARLPHHSHVRIDLRGHGLSDVPPADYSIPAMTDDVLGLLDLVGLDRVVVVGISVGGQIALRAALERPDVVVGVVALDTAGRIGERAAWDERIAAVRTHGVAAIADATVARWFGPSFRAREPAAVRGYRNLLLRTPPDGYAATCAALRDEDLGLELATITPRALVLCGSEDAATPPGLVRALAASLPDAKYVEIEDAAHLPCIDRPDVVARHIDAFVLAIAVG